MQIRTLFLTCMFAVAAMASCLGGWILTAAVEDYRLAGQMQLTVDIRTSLFAVADALVAERPIIGEALLGEAPADATVRAKIASLRQVANHAIVVAEERIQRADFPGTERQLEMLSNIRMVIAVSRAKVDEMLALPKSERDPTVFGNFLVGLTALFDILDPAITVDDLGVVPHDDVTMDLMSMTRQLWSIREQLSSRIPLLMSAIDQHVPVTPSQYKDQLRLDGRLSQGWATLDVLWPRLAGVPEIATALATPLMDARAAFEAQDAVHQAALATLQSGKSYSMTAPDLGHLATQTFRAFGAICDAAQTAARTRVQQNQQAAALRVVVAGGVVLLILALTIVVLTVLRWRIVSPVLALTKAIDRLALRDYAVEIPARSHRNEIGRMAAAVETLRKGAIAAVEAETRIKQLVRHDALTGLANKALLHERVEHALASVGRGQICAALSADLDHFGTINNTYGHAFGDRLLQAAADRLTACVRETDTVGRIGGDEFVILAVNLEDADSVVVLAKRIVRTLSEPYEMDGQSVVVGVRIGIAIAPQDATSAESLLCGADSALDRAKQDEPGSYRFFEPEMDARLQVRLTLERDLRNAIQTNGFEVLYQPQYNLAKNRLCGFEALLRWHHPTRGMVGPNEFIPIAEETGLIVPIGKWVLRQACGEAMNWPDTVKVAVNLSNVQFRNPGIAQTVRQALDESGLSPHRLDLEIKESLLLSATSAILGTLQELQDMGVGIALDDFGTGYSSLSHLRGFPFDKVKLDPSFIRDLADRDDTQAVIRAVIAMGNSLGMTTTAEGVETVEQLDWLRRDGCTEVQGYLFSRPASAGAARELASGLQEATASEA